MISRIRQLRDTASGLPFVTDRYLLRLAAPMAIISILLMGLGGDHVGDQMGQVVVTRFAEMDFVARPLPAPFGAIARIHVVGRLEHVSFRELFARTEVLLALLRDELALPAAT